ncbi:MAG: methyltransferase domain-containing protein [Chloroflexi bacterium]|nr:methyltransferase domain-containing protein [Chloroflexota bacterium]
MLLVGMPRPLAGHTPCSPGITLDIDPRVTEVCGPSGVVADVQDIPFPNAYFGAVAAFHVLEHLSDIESTQRAWRELWRVTATTVVVAYPRRWNFYAAFLQPEHHLWVYPDGDRLLVNEREGQRRTAWVLRDGAAELV